MKEINIINKLVTALIGVMMCAAVAQAQNNVPAKIKLSLDIEGMTCTGCVDRATSGVKQLDGVTVININLEKKEGNFEYDSSKVTENQIMQAIVNAGFTAFRKNAVANATLKVSGNTCQVCANNVEKTSTHTNCEVNCETCGNNSSSCCGAQVKSVTMTPATLDRVSFFDVPLVCPAAPEIGCGSRAKPVLVELERKSEILEAWLNRTGTVLAVVGSENSTTESRAETIESVLQSQEVAVSVLDGDRHQQELKSFLSGDGWYRGVEVDSLSKEEAGIIAARLVRRVRADVELSSVEANSLEVGLADAFEERFITDAEKLKQTKAQKHREELLKVAQAHLDEKGVAAFQAAIAKGYRPEPNEK